MSNHGHEANKKTNITSVPPILICHYAKLIERKKHLLSQFENNNITNYEFIEHYDRDNISNDDRCIFNEKVNDALAAVHLTHIHAYKEIEHKYEHALILEDDIILTDNFVNKMQKYCTQLPEDYDMLFIGDGCNHHIARDKLISNVNVYKRCLFSTPTCKEEFASRCSDSYMVSKKGAIKLNNYITNLTSKISSPIDWWLNDAAKDNDLNVYWAEPTIVTQGSQRGLFSSSIGNCSHW